MCIQRLCPVQQHKNLLAWGPCIIPVPQILKKKTPKVRAIYNITSEVSTTDD